MWNERTLLLIHEENVKRLQQCNVLIVGVGGVGAYSAEHICRSGIGAITIVDADSVSESNINRQLIALHSTIGIPKVELMRDRMLDINPELKIEARNMFVTTDNIPEIVGSQHFDYIVDAIDTIAPKIALLTYAYNHNIPVISSMGAGGRTDPTKISVTDISKTYNDKLASVVRQRLRKEGIMSGIKVVFSTEVADTEAVMQTPGARNQCSVRGTVSYIPALFGTMIAGTVIKDLITK